MIRYLSLVWVLAAVGTGAPRLAQASGEPLLVVVEARPGAAVDPGEVRQAIAAELRAPVRSPRDAAAEEGTADVLIVTVDRAGIAMSLRTGAATVVSRVVAAPGDRKGRLEGIAWLAGNLARDQAGAILAAAPAPAAVTAATAQVGTPSPGTPSPAEVPPPSPLPATEPPPLAAHVARDLAPTSNEVVVTQPVPAAAGRPSWSMTIGGGPSALWRGNGDREQRLWPGPGVWYLEVQRRAAGERLIVGAALDVGPDMAMGLRSASLDFIGGAATVGVGHRFGRTFVEATGGLGLEVYQSGANVTTSMTTTPTGIQSESQTVPTAVVGLYLRGQATAGLALSRSFDLLASAGGHLGSVGLWDHFLTGSLGLRLRFN